MNLPYADDLARRAETKLPKGTKQLAHRAKSATSSTHEKAEKLASKIRDKRQCRWPHCEHRTKRLSIHSAHLVHKGIGGSDTRNERANLITFCAVHHGQFDLGNLLVKPRTKRQADGPCSFYLNTKDHVVARLVARETAVGVLEPER